MKVELLPVIEIIAASEDIDLPESGPYWGFPKEWEDFNKKCLARAGFENMPMPYRPGSSFYQPSDVSSANLFILLKEKTKDLLTGEFDRNQISALDGGFVLRVNDEDVFFPQCCGDLSDVHYWEGIFDENERRFYSGHPGPAVKSYGGLVSFDFHVGPHDERFVPPPRYPVVTVDGELLRAALEKAKELLVAFGKRLQEINAERSLDIERIDELLIWGAE